MRELCLPIGMVVLARGLASFRSALTWAEANTDSQGWEIDWCSARIFTVLDIPGHPLAEEIQRGLKQQAARKQEQQEQHDAMTRAAQLQGMPTAQVQPLPGHGAQTAVQQMASIFAQTTTLLSSCAHMASLALA